MNALDGSHGCEAAVAAVRVLYCPELLEMILFALPIRDLLLSQRICTTFRDVINSSVTLQRCLFLAPTSKSMTNNNSKLQHIIFTTNDSSKLEITSGPISAENSCFTPSGHMFYVNPFLSILWPAPTPTPGGSRDGHGYTTYGRTTWNELHIVSRMQLSKSAIRQQSLRLTIPTMGTPNISSTTSHPASVEVEAVVEAKAEAKAKAVNHPQASWRKMYLTQPPVCRPISVAYCCFPCGTVESEVGVTLACVKEWEAEWGGGGFGIGCHEFTHVLTLLFGEVCGPS